MANLSEILERGTNTDELAAHLDALEPAERLGQVRALAAADLGQLFWVCKGRRVPLEHFVPVAAGPSGSARHLGVASRSFLRPLERTFARVGDRLLVGRESGPAARWTGPGYFAVAPPEPGKPARFVYTDAPPAVPDGWPAPRPHDKGFARRAYGEREDEVLRVSEHVVIARVLRAGAPTKHFLALAREP